MACDTQRIAFWHHPNAIPLARALQAEALSQQAKRYGEVRDWLAGLKADHAVISSEFFSGCYPQALKQALTTHVPDHAASARVIAYVRPHHSRFLAQFIQRTKAGNYFGGIRALLDDTGVAETLHYARRFGGWRTTFGDRFILRPFLRPELREQDAVIDFLSELLGENPFFLTEPVEENVAVTLRALAGIRMMQKRFKEAGIGPFGRAILGGAMSTQFLPAGPLVGDKPVLDKATAQALTSRYHADAVKLDAMFFGKPLMQQSLERAPDKAIVERMNLKPSLHFTRARRQQIAGLSDDIASQFQQKPELWPMYYRGSKNQITLSLGDQVRLKANHAFLQDIDGKMMALADLLRDRG